MADEARQKQFIETLILNGGPVALNNDLPPAAMVACAIEESGYGTSSIYKETGCPFNLQRPSWYVWVKCQTKLLKTCTKTDAKGDCIETRFAPFCLAQGGNEDERLADAARLWCEWILGWPQKGVREKMLGLRDKPEEFTLNLPSVGFGEVNKRQQNGQKFLEALRRHALVEKCRSMIIVVDEVVISG